jgi:methylated-DNA-[protein]-cysteine S-methyltransferase
MNPAATAEEADKLERLHGRLEEGAAREELLEIAYTTIDSPIGPLLLAATERGLVRIAFAMEDHDKVLESLATKLSPRILRAPQRLDQAAREIDEYFAGARKSFDLSLDFSLSRGFRQHVQRYLTEIGYGQTESYSQVAERVGNPKAVRAVGTACGTNPMPVVVPCHRVLRSDGSLGGYLAGLPTKTALLKLEGAM